MDTALPKQGNIKVTRDDWLAVARDTLVTEGMGEVKILPLANRLGVARSSFYWYFDSHAELVQALLTEWEARNTKCIIDKCALPAMSISEAVCHFFECFIDPMLFDQGLDFAIREWSRRDTEVRAKIDAADAQRIAAMTKMFERHGFDPSNADARARILYFMQLGYHALEIKEPMETRLARVRGYLIGFTDEVPSDDVVAAFCALARRFKVA
ncbi:MAG: TetR/AcrR family transcriptional regulator [Marinovum sp.]|nr:TetR/AcrR family transcriptional regulator [Marinovum sp.]